MTMTMEDTQMKPMMASAMFTAHPVSEDNATLSAVADAMKQLEHFMHDAVGTDVEVLRDASRHIIEAGGKRVRPRLMFLAYLALGGDTLSTLLPMAAAVELVHTASVVHDDINDHGVIRRGRPSVNSVWGRTFALLTGDYLFTKVYELMAPHGALNIILAEATKALVEGETLQAAAVKDNNFSRAVYYDIIGRKTAALFRAAVCIGAQSAGATAEQEEALGQFGFNIGLAFQIVDDLLDLVGDESQMGKTSGIDVEQGRGFAVAFASEDEADPLQAIRARVMQGDAVQEGYDRANDLVNLAIAQLDVLPEGDAKAGLIAAAQSVVNRQF